MKRAVIFYDLEVGPESYNFAMFMVFAKRWVEDHGIDRVRLVFVPGKKDGFRSMGNPHGAHYSHWRLNQLLLPLATAFWPEASVVVCRSRDEAEEEFEIAKQKGEIYPEEYSLENPICPYSDIHLSTQDNSRKQISGFVPSEKSLEYIETWKNNYTDGKRLISITLRESDYQTPRNSDYLEWVKFVEWLDPKKYKVVVVPDTNHAFDRKANSHGLEIFCEASFNVELRHALYQSSWLNLFVNSGPPMLCVETHGIPYLYFKLLAGDTECANLINSEDSRFLPGCLWPGAGQHQKLIWETDRASMIQKAFSIQESRMVSEDTWNEERIFSELEESQSHGDLQSACEWTACLVAFFEDLPQSWLRRAEVLMLDTRHHEAYLTLVQASESVPDFKEAMQDWNCFEKELNVDLKSLQHAFVKLISEGSPWQKKPQFNAFLSELDADSQSDKYLIYGAGQGGRLAKERLPSSVEIHAFIDGDPNKQGTSVDGVPVLSPERVQTMDFDHILIASMARNEIYYFLLSLGVTVNQIHILEDEWILPSDKLPQTALNNLSEMISDNSK